MTNNKHFSDLTPDEIDFVFNGLTVKEISTKYKISEQAVHKKKNKRSWIDKRSSWLELSASKLTPQMEYMVYEKTRFNIVSEALKKDSGLTSSDIKLLKELDKLSERSYGDAYKVSISAQVIHDFMSYIRDEIGDKSLLEDVKPVAGLFIRFIFDGVKS